MKKSVSIALLLTLAFTAVIPSFAQKGIGDGVRQSVKGQTEFVVTRAVTDGTGVVVHWAMKNDAKTVGFNVYRVSPNGRELVNLTMVVGLWGKSGVRAVGEPYQIFDPLGEVGSTYVVEGVTSAGSRFSSREIGVLAVKDVEVETGTSSAAFLTASLSQNSNVEQRSLSLTSGLNDLVSLHSQTPDPINQRWVAAQPGAKIAVTKDGFHRVSAGELQGANFPINSDSANWRLFRDGVEQAIIVGAGGEYIEFYGRGLDAPLTNTRNYYLISGTVAGRRIATRNVRPVAGSATSSRYSVRAQKKERTEYADKLFNGDGENYLGRLILDQPNEINFNLSGVDATASAAEITINLFGLSDNAHLVRAKINGNILPPLTQNGRVFFWNTTAIPASFLLEGTNTLELASSAPGDFNVFDNVIVKYGRKYQSDDNKISFFTPGYRKVDVTSFSSSNVRIFDMTFDGVPTLLANVPIVAEGTSYTAKIPSSRTMVAYGIEESGLLQSPSVRENFPSTLAAATNTADMLIISHSAPGFMAASETWAAYRRTQAGGGYAVKVVDIADVFDEFSYGEKGSAGIKSFLKHAHTEWQTSPRYILFMGKASYDPRNYEGWGITDLVPSQSVTMIFFESVSDDALGDFNNDGLAEVAIGRIPALNVASIDAAFSKTVAFESPTSQSLSRGALFAHDLPNGYDFAGMSQILADQLPVGTPVTMTDRASPTAQADLIAGMNTGKFIVNYSGHGAAGLWASSGFFSNVNVPQLTNADRPSIYVMLTCLSGYFIRPNALSLSEALLHWPGGGAAAAWASSGETTPDIQLVMGTRFFNQMATGNLKRIGDLIRDSKTVIEYGADVRLSWVLLGDPALKVR